MLPLTTCSLITCFIGRRPRHQLIYTHRRMTVFQSYLGFVFRCFAICQNYYAKKSSGRCSQVQQ
jgi:hypothetical protein